VVGAAERLLEQADQCQDVAAWHDEQATAGTPAERLVHDRAAMSYRIVELALRIVANALNDGEDA
jgi:hypothetical protein